MTSTTARARSYFYWLIPAAFLAHCAEELPRFPRWATKHFGTTTTQFYLASHAILLPAVITAGTRAANRPSSRGAAFFAASVTSALGLNGVFHIATTRLFGEYSPGVITGAAAMLPAAIYTLLRIKRDNLLTEEQILGAFLTGTALSTAAIASLYVNMPRLGGT